jgi:hypothetical protein
MLKLSAGFLLMSSLDTLCSDVMDEVDESFVKVWQPCFYSSMTVVKLYPKKKKKWKDTSI